MRPRKAYFYKKNIGGNIGMQLASFRECAEDKWAVE